MGFDCVSDAFWQIRGEEKAIYGDHEEYELPNQSVYE